MEVGRTRCGTRREIRKDNRHKLTFGIHSRIVNLESRRQINNWLVDLEVLIVAKRVVAVGEFGLDQQAYTYEKDFDRHINTLENQLQLSWLYKSTSGNSL